MNKSEVSVCFDVALTDTKEHRKIEDLKKDFQATVAQQQKEIAALAATVKEQASQIQKVSAQLELSKPASQTVLNRQ